MDADAAQLATLGINAGSALLSQGITAQNAARMEKLKRRTKKVTSKLDTMLESAKAQTESARSRAQEADAAARQAEAEAAARTAYVRYAALGGAALSGALLTVWLVRTFRRP